MVKSVPLKKGGRENRKKNGYRTHEKKCLHKRCKNGFRTYLGIDVPQRISLVLDS